MRRHPPRTRYQGSKRKLLPWLASELGKLQFETVLDAFGGTGSVSYWLKAEGKQVTYNDHLAANAWIGRALVENARDQLTRDAAASVFRRAAGRRYDDVVARHFSGIYFLDHENEQLDLAAQNIAQIAEPYARAVAWYALFQSCIAKRPYNLFHRRNLYVRTADVSRSFGNKTTWDRAFEAHFESFRSEANAAVFAGARPCRALHGDAREVEGRFDLVYVDPPYLNARGVGVNYADFYHFLEGLVDYPRWPERIDFTRKHRPLRAPVSPWSDPHRSAEAFVELFDRFADATVVVSYRSDGIPSIPDLVRMLSRTKRHVTVQTAAYRYALSTNRTAREVLLVGTGSR